MAAYNPQCHSKGCKCATCEYLCSRCLVSDNLCITGVKDCDRYKATEDTFDVTIIHKSAGGSVHEHSEG